MFGLTLQRYSTRHDSTLGVLLLTTDPSHPEFICYTLEDGPRSTKVPGETRIPEGVYPLALRREGGLHARYATRFPEFHRGMIWIRHIPEFEWVCFHIGNDPDDTAGCPLVGSSPSSALSAGHQKVYKSTQAYREFYPKAAEAIEESPHNSTLTVRDRV